MTLGKATIITTLSDNVAREYSVEIIDLVNQNEIDVKGIKLKITDEAKDYIVENGGGCEGTVKEIQLFYTKLTTLDNKTIIIPNGMLTNNSLTNVTEKNERKLDLKVDISYESDLRKAKDILARLVDAEERIMKDEEIQVFVHELGASSVVLGLRAWVKAEDYWDVRWKLLEDIKLTFDAEGIEIPFQQLTVHVDSEK